MKDRVITLRINDEIAQQLDYLKQIALPYNLTTSEIIRGAVAAEVARKQGGGTVNSS
jgi:predicted transcriptional regulator